MRAGGGRSDGSVGASGSSLVAASRRRGRSASAGGRSDGGSDWGRNNDSGGSGLGGGARNGQGDGSVDYGGGVDNGAGGRGLRSSGQGGGRAAAGGHNGAGRALRGRQSEGRRLSIDDTVLLASGVTNEGTALPALGNTARRRVSGNVVRAAARSANGVGVAADDDTARKAVVGVGLGAGHLVGALGRSLSAGQSGGGGDDDGGGSHFECDFLFACLLYIYGYNGCEGDIKILGGCRYWCKWLSDEREYSAS